MNMTVSVCVLPLPYFVHLSLYISHSFSPGSLVYLETTAPMLKHYLMDWLSSFPSWDLHWGQLDSTLPLSQHACIILYEIIDFKKLRQGGGKTESGREMENGEMEGKWKNKCIKAKVTIP